MGVSYTVEIYLLKFTEKLSWAVIPDVNSIACLLNLDYLLNIQYVSI